MEYNDKLKLKEECQDKLRWDEQKGRLRRPCITQSQQLLFNERANLVKAIPDFWAIALFADHGLVRYMNHEEREV
ncbi:hypothetical protein MKW94_011938 [Papaver nudicaule]|uniref:Uncharacterized protein n=1 Tax=Papaver nudicaule TaxID=74823 RepID=A0AA41S9K5_PAPNU|nr:hypothetical protein [Papaver nudicaule]